MKLTWLDMTIQGCMMKALTPVFSCECYNMVLQNQNATVEARKIPMWGT